MCLCTARHWGVGASVSCRQRVGSVIEEIFSPASLFSFEVFVVQGWSWQPSWECTVGLFKESKLPKQEVQPCAAWKQDEAERKEGNPWTRNSATVHTTTHTHTRTGTSDQALLTPAKMDISPGPHRRLVWFILCCVLLNSQGAHKQLGVDGSGFLLCSCVQILPQKLHAAPDLYRLTYPEIWWMGGYVLESDWFTVSGKSAKEPQLHNIGNK